MISQREMRNNSGEVLRRVAAGESLLISNGGQPAAMLVPVPASARERLIAVGALEPARQPLDLASWRPADLPDADPSEAVLTELRGER